MDIGSWSAMLAIGSEGEAINKRIIAITAVLAFSLNALSAQGRFEYGGDLAGGARNGTSSAVSLLIPQGAAYLSGGGAVATATGVGAAYWMRFLAENLTKAAYKTMDFPLYWL